MNIKNNIDMKNEYIKPTIFMEDMESEELMTNSISGVSGLDGVEKSDNEFSGGAADARGGRFSTWEEQ